MEKQIFSTEDYSKFKRLCGNREVSPLRVKKIISSIVKVGYITNPIIVNENMEIIDGQGRFEALKELSIPIDYIVCKQTGIEERQSMNINNSNWKDIDYIRSFSEIGNENYQRFLYCILYNDSGIIVASTALKNVNRINHKTIVSGELVITQSEFEKAKEKLEYLERFNDILASTQLPGKFVTLKQMILFCSEMECVDKERLFNQLSKYINLLPSYHNIESCSYALEQIYNRNSRDYAYISTEYRKIARDNSYRHINAYNKSKMEVKDDEQN